MKQISVKDLIPGMIVASDILNFESRIIVPKDVILTENIISRLENYSIYYVSIKDQVFEELSTPMTGAVSIDEQLSDSDDLSNKEKIRSSTQFLRFSKDFDKCAEHFKDNLMNAIYQNQPFYAQELLAETMQLLTQDDGSVSVFDMLLNMRNIDDSVYAHCIDVALISNMLAKWLHFSEEDQIMATSCGLFHDVGKFMLPQDVLRKPGKLTAQEFEIIKTHTIEGFHLLGKYSNIPQTVKNAALMHHEKCDGSGYPYGLKGNEIDRFSKIVTIADIFDAMTSERVYRKAMCPFSVIKAFEDEGIQKYEMKYILTFLENVANSYLNHRVSLTNGLEGNVIFINKDDYSRPVVLTEDNQIINLQEQYYKNIMDLSANKNISIETII